MTDDREARVAIGRITGSFGLRGDVKLAGADAADVGSGLRVSVRLRDGSERALTVETVRRLNDRLVVRFGGIDGRAAVEPFRGADVFANRADLPPLPEGTFRREELIGMRVVDARLGELGDVSDVLRYPHADMLVVGERSTLVPLLAAYGVAIDVTARTIATNLPPGFEEL